ncbi:MAG TPA: hypothetical protein VMQ67_00560, partial [Candidatus Saccharimonadales bacterium]|nr:hypothetical protein [Candidatus Saccharimonadales bacterium]
MDRGAVIGLASRGHFWVYRRAPRLRLVVVPAGDLKRGRSIVNQVEIEIEMVFSHGAKTPP